MYLSDFVYRDVKLSDYGCVIGYLTAGSDESVSLGSVLTQTTSKNNATYRQELLASTYNDPVGATFDIIKNPCSVYDKSYFSDDEISSIMRWLSAKDNNKFVPIYDDENYLSVYFNGTFTEINAISIGGHVVGLNVTFTADEPFARETDIELTYNFTKVGDEFAIFNDTDDFGYLYPSCVQLTIHGGGDLELCNSLDSYVTLVKNCVDGEVLTLDCEHEIITSSLSHPKLANDFNYKYPRLISSWEEKKNIFTVNIPCEMKIVYAPVRKVGILA